MTQTPDALPYPWGLVSGKHAPRVPVQVASVGCVLGFSKAIDVPGGEAGGDADEHVVECEAKELRIPAAARKGIMGGEMACVTGFKQLNFQGQQNYGFPRPCPEPCSSF